MASGDISVTLPEMRRTPAGLTRVSKSGVVTGIGTKLNIIGMSIQGHTMVGLSMGII